MGYDKFTQTFEYKFQSAASAASKAGKWTRSIVRGRGALIVVGGAAYLAYQIGDKQACVAFSRDFVDRHSHLFLALYSAASRGRDGAARDAYFNLVVTLVDELGTGAFGIASYMKVQDEVVSDLISRGSELPQSWQELTARRKK